LGRACPLCPGISDINLFRYCQGVIDFDAEIPDRAFDLGMPEQKLDGPQVARLPIDQGGLSASQRMRPEQPGVQSDAADPLGDKAGILARCHVAVGTTTTGEQELAGLLVGSLQIVIDGLAGLLAQFKSDGPPGFLLPDGCAIRRVLFPSCASDHARDRPICRPRWAIGITF